MTHISLQDFQQNTFHSVTVGTVGCPGPELDSSHPTAHWYAEVGFNLERLKLALEVKVSSIAMLIIIKVDNNYTFILWNKEDWYLIPCHKKERNMRIEFLGIIMYNTF